MRLNVAQRPLFAERATEFGNFAVTALLLGQLMAETFRLDWTVVGGLGGLATYYASAKLTDGANDDG